MRTALLFIVLLFVALQLRAQESQPRWFLGVVGGYNANYHSSNFLLPDAGNILQSVPGTGSGNGMILGLASDYWFTNKGISAIQLKIYYEQKLGDFTWTGAPQMYYDSVNGILLARSDFINIRSTFNLLNAEALFRFNFWRRVGLSIGPELRYVLRTSYSQYEVFEPSTALPPQQSMNPFNRFGEVASASIYQLGIKLNMQYEILAGRFLITPAVSYDYGITKVAPGWSVNTLAGTVDVKYGL